MSRPGKSKKIDDGNDKVKVRKTNIIKNFEEEDIENDNLRDELEKMDKKELVKLVTDLGKSDLRHINFNIAMLSERLSHFKKAVEELEKSIEVKSHKAQKYRNIGDDPK